MPVAGRNVQHLAGPQDALRVCGVGEERESVRIRVANIDLARISKQPAIMWIEAGGARRRKQPEILAADNLGQEVAVRVVVQRRDRVHGPELRIHLHDLPIADAAVVWRHDVLLQLGDLVEELVLGQVSKIPPLWEPQ